MESNKHTIENFERFLRDKTDEFKMYPSKRVWYSIYNNMHPGNRLPSVSMSIILIGFLFLVGYLHTTDARKAVNTSTNVKPKPDNELVAIAANQPNSKQAFTINSSGNIQNKKTTLLAKTNKSISYNRQLTLAINNNTPRNIAATPHGGNKNTVAVYQRIAKSQKPIAALDENSAEAGNIYSAATKNNPDASEENKSLAVTSGNNPPNEIIEINNTPEAVLSGNSAATLLKDNGIADDISKKEEFNTGAKTRVTINTNAVNTLSQANKAWIEDFAFHNSPVKKWAGKLSMQFYFTPSIVYRKLNNNAAGKILAGNSNTRYNNTSVDNSVTHKPSFGVETGLSLQYEFAKRIKLKAGIQLNYTRYNAHAYETNHPVATTVTMSNAEIGNIYEQSKMSYYSNTFGFSKVKLHNETYQLSLPIGADFKLASIDNITWYAGATLQPTFVLKGRSYIISTDRINYVQDGSLLNRFNLNAGFETYFSYKTDGGYKWQLGPQYRTQIFSTNTKVYSIEERLQNFGFKFGITKTLR